MTTLSPALPAHLAADALPLYGTHWSKGQTPSQILAYPVPQEILLVEGGAVPERKRNQWEITARPYGSQ